MFTSKFGSVKPRIGIKDYMILVAMFFVTSVCNNYAFDFNIPMPLHMIFRAVRQEELSKRNNNLLPLCFPSAVKVL